MKILAALAVFLFMGVVSFANDSAIIRGSTIQMVEPGNTNIVMEEEEINIHLRLFQNLSFWNSYLNF